jgi:FAD dependent oxidoreductase
MYITPEQNLRSVRTAPHGEGQRLLIVTGEKFTPGTDEVSERYQRLAAWTRQHFPGAEITHRWAAQDNATTDSVPYVGHFHPGAKHVYVATGFAGWGMSNGVMSGRLLAAQITGEKPPWTKLYDPRRLHLLREAPALLKFQAGVATHFVGDRLRPQTSNRSRTSSLALAPWRGSTADAAPSIVTKPARSMLFRRVAPISAASSTSMMPSKRGSARATGPDSMSMAP